MCGDPWGQRPRNHEAPGGRYANGIIVKEYRVGETMEVEIDLSANHRGSFTFKLCQNNNVRRDSHQRCFDRYVNSDFLYVYLFILCFQSLKNIYFFQRHTLKVYPEMTESFELPSEASQTFYIQLKLPEGVTCKQCVLQVGQKKYFSSFHFIFLITDPRFATMILILSVHKKLLITDQGSFIGNCKYL